VKTKDFNFRILIRSGKYACIVQDLKSGQMFTLPANSLPVQAKGDKASVARNKKESWSKLVNFFDPAKVDKITISFPKRGALTSVDHDSLFTFNLEESNYERDMRHPYMLIHCNDGVCLVFPCTSGAWSPHKAPMKILVADARTCGVKLALWDNNMDKKTAVDLSRMASLPTKYLSTHFNDSYTTATQKDAVLACAMQVMLCHAALDGTAGDAEDEDEDDCCMDLDEESDEYQRQHCSLVIGDYEVDEETHLPATPQ
jgi:hypothetical protein